MPRMPWLPRGTYTISHYGPIVGESGDGAFLMGSQGVSGVFSFDVDSFDGRTATVSPVMHTRSKLRAIHPGDEYLMLSPEGWLSNSRRLLAMVDGRRIRF